jgi:outer membrane immunogenic protein
VNKLTLAGVSGALLLGAGAASAADLPRRTAPPATPVFTAVPVFTWTGFYVGANAGYGWHTKDSSSSFAGADDDRGGFVGGGQIGFNYQMGPLVTGLEADLQYADLQRRGYTASGVTVTGTDDPWFGTVRGRLGFAADRFLVYGTGGLAYGNVGNQRFYDAVTGATYGADDTKVGWTLGAGVEYAFTNNLTAKVEGLYVNLGDKDRTYTAGGVTYGDRTNGEFGVVRAGVNYKF